jgi:two-component system CheB/CheR fusion protein
MASLTQGAPSMLRILVVDDWPDSITSLQLLLQQWGYEARVAADGPTALEMNDNFKPDVMILDIDLPGMDGHEVAERLRQVNPHKPIIIAYSGYCEKADIRRALDSGCNYHLCKPTELDEVKRLLEACEQWLVTQTSP